MAGQFIFISSATVYRRPPPCYIVTEDTPLGNDYWPYAQAKIACEELLVREHRERKFPVTIVRPSSTYGPTKVPTAIGSGHTVVDRMRRGRPVLVHGDGQSLWTLTHNTDFAKALVGLLGNARAVGEAFHITSDEVLTWDGSRWGFRRRIEVVGERGHRGRIGDLRDRANDFDARRIRTKIRSLQDLA